MNDKVYVYDPTVEDALSKVRGVGRYLQILRENFPQFAFTADLTRVEYRSVFINPFFNFLQPPVLSRRIAQRQIAVIHDLIPLKYAHHFPHGIRGKLNIFLNKLAFKNYDLVITDSETSKKDIMRILHVDDKKVKVIYPTLPVKFMKIENCQLKIENYCIYVGDATWNKNLVNLAKAVKSADVYCIFVGKVFQTDPGSLTHPWQAELRLFLTETKDDKRFILKGFVADEELIKLYRRARANLLVSRDEGFGFSYLEASSLGCPSVLSDIPILREISSGAALYANPNDYEDIGQKIRQIYINDDLREQIGKRAHERSSCFFPDEFKSSFMRLINY
jgi:glycosyltransferase involved in cell wall biosynthesis